MGLPSRSKTGIFVFGVCAFLLFSKPLFATGPTGSCILSELSKADEGLSADLQTVDILDHSIDDLYEEYRRSSSQFTPEECRAIKKMEGLNQSMDDHEAARLYHWQVMRTIRNLKYQVRNLRGSISAAGLDLHRAASDAIANLKKTIPEFQAELNPDSDEPLKALRSFAFGTHVAGLTQEQATRVLELWALKPTQRELLLGRDSLSPEREALISSLMMELAESLKLEGFDERSLTHYNFQQRIDKYFADVKQMGCCGKSCVGCVVSPLCTYSGGIFGMQRYPMPRQLKWQVVRPLTRLKPSLIPNTLVLYRVENELACLVDAEVFKRPGATLKSRVRSLTGDDQPAK